MIAAREHYKERGLPEGSHAEGAIFNSILGNKIPHILALPDYFQTLLRIRVPVLFDLWIRDRFFQIPDLGSSTIFLRAFQICEICGYKKVKTIFPPFFFVVVFGLGIRDG